MNVSSKLILLIRVLNYFAQYYHLNWFLTINDKYIIDYLQATIHNSMNEIRMLLHSILDTISKQIKWLWQIPRDDSWFDPLHRLLKIKKWGILQKDKMGKCKNQIMNCIYCPKKPKVKPPLNRKGNQRLGKKNDQWDPISKRWTPSTWHIFKHLALVKLSKEISIMIVEINNH
jgi:hypothetical protein